MPPKEKRSYAEPPEIRNITKGKGEEIFGARCAFCHPIGMTDAEPGRKAPLGPDLLVVNHKLNRAWLLRWMKESDKMLKADDESHRLGYKHQ